MLSLVDMMDMCECTEEEIEAIGIHEHVPDAISSEIGAYLMHCDKGIPRLKKIIVEDIDHARQRGDQVQIKKFNTILMHFIANHPEYPAVNQSI